MTDPKDKPKRRILYLVDAFSQSAWYRCSVPGAELQNRGFGVALSDAATEANLAGFDVVVFLRHFGPGSFQLMMSARAAGKLVVYDIDDALWNLNPSDPGYPFYSKPEVVGGIEKCLRVAHLVTTTSETLAAELRKRNPNVRVLPNMLPEKAWPFEGAKPQTDEHVIVGYAGMSSHYEDLSILKKVGRELLETYPSAWLVCCGMAEVPFAPHERLSVIPPADIEQYPEVLRTFDIGLAPLSDTPFNRCTSDTKALEYSMVGIPVVASDIDAYRGLVKHGETGFLAKSAKQWKESLHALVEDRELRETIGGKANEVARGRLIERNIDLWVEAYAQSPGVGPISVRLPESLRGKPKRMGTGRFIRKHRDKHLGETCYIVGKGPSIASLTKESFGDGPVICLSEAFLAVQDLGLDNPIYSMQKDGCGAYHQRDVGCAGCEGVGPCMIYPNEDVTLLLHEHESKNCLPNHAKREVFDAVDLGLGGWSTSSPCAIRIAKVFGCKKVVLFGHDSFFGDFRTALQTDGEPAELGDNRFHYSHILNLVVDELQDIDFEIVP